jgi:NADH-quinone oxidoreductase subunit E
VLEVIAREMRVPLSRVYGVATFYSQFHLARRGRHIVRQCDGTACHVKGSARIIDAAESALGIKAGQTTPDYRVTFEVVYCLGSCGLAPVAMVDDEIVGHLVPETMVEILDRLE